MAIHPLAAPDEKVWAGDRPGPMKLMSQPSIILRVLGTFERMSAVLSRFFHKCSGNHAWTSDGECESCGKRCTHTARVMRVTGDAEKRRVSSCVTCGMTLHDR